MKKATLLFGAVMTLLFISCEGPVGPPGFDGFDGLDGQDGADAPLSQVIDVEGDFTAENEYSILFDFPQTVEVFETDVVLVYLLWDQTEDSNGEAVDIWRLMPQTRILDQGLLQYNFDHTFLDVSMFLEADFDLGTLQSGDTDAQVFRIAILPAEMATGSRMDKSNIANVMQTLGVEEKDIPRLKVN
ncbi:MAG: collagen-like protein [Aurantibacter sp.]